MKYEEHEGNDFLVINPAKYIAENANIQNCLIGSKIANITAEKGKVGQVVKTIMKDGFTETSNVVSYDIKTGEPDWIVTQATGERMIVNDTKFKNLYEYSAMQEGKEIAPTGKYRSMMVLNENVALKASWGGMQYIKKGGVLVVLANNDIYGIQKDEFEKSYKVIRKGDVNSLNGVQNALTIVSKETKKPTIFLSVAYPYESEKDQNILKSVIRYVNSKGIKAVNIRNTSGENIRIINEIQKCLDDCDGILSLAFNKGGNKTSPFIQIETALAQGLNLDTLMIVPKAVEKEGVLFEGSVDGKIVELDNDSNLDSDSNKKVVEMLDGFIEQAVKHFKYGMTKDNFSQFKDGLLNPDTSKNTKQEVVKYLKNYYETDEEFNFDEIYVKKPMQVKAVEIKSAGIYETKNGKTYLNEGDFLVTDLDGKVYSVEKQAFEERYIKVKGEEDKYITNITPTIARAKNGGVEVFALTNTDDKYSPDKEVFELKYQSLRDYIYSLSQNKTSENVQEL